MEEAPDNCKESSHCAHDNGMNGINWKGVVADWIWTIMVNQFKPYLQKYKNKKFNDHCFCSLNDWWGKRKVRLWWLWQHANVKTKSTFFFIRSRISKMSHTKTKCNLQFHSLFTHQGTKRYGVYQCEIWSSHHGCWWLNLLGLYKTSTAKQLPMFKKNHNAFIFSLLGWRHCGPKRCQQLPTRWHRITSHKIWIFKTIFIRQWVLHYTQFHFPAVSTHWIFLNGTISKHM
jgi:hypothetical protein